MTTPSVGRPISVTLPGVFATVLVFAAAAVCVRLGFWQLDRLAERRERNAQLADRLEAPPIALEAVPSDTTGWLNRRVTLSGTYDETHTMVYAGRLLGGVPGVHVIAPLVLEGSGARVLVNRGWLPAADAATPDTSLARSAGPVRATGVVVPFPGGVSHAPRNGAAGHATVSGEFRMTWFTIDTAAIRAQFPYALGGIAIQLLPEPASGPWPARLPAPRLDQGPHLGYAIQWFSFAVIAIVGWSVLVMKSRVRTLAAARRDEHP
ncbi:MAG: SURF1 family protein [Gemmatimonadetes bacterium]|nr:SURF1 family protein [Gemmatimonadota bacterium]